MGTAKHNPTRQPKAVPSDIIHKNKNTIHPAAGSHVFGFGGGFVPPPKPKRIKRSKNNKFGERTIGQLPLRFVPIARYMISLLKELADDCANGGEKAHDVVQYFRYRLGSCD